MDAAEIVIGAVSGGGTSFVATYAVLQYRVSQLEKANGELKKQLKDDISAVSRSKADKFSDIRKDLEKQEDDLKERIQVAHQRVDRLRDDWIERHNNLAADMRSSSEKLEAKLEQGFNQLTQRIDTYFNSKG